MYVTASHNDADDGDQIPLYIWRHLRDIDIRSYLSTYLCGGFLI